MHTLKQEIMDVGTWNGLEFTVEDLKAIKQAFDALGSNHKVPLKMGHNDEQPFTDGQPALGWVTALEVVGSKLVATLSNVPDIVAKAIGAKLYRNVSVELDGGVKWKENYFDWVLSGLALLGADIPAVNTLNDLDHYLPKGGAMRAHRQVAFSTVTGNLKENKAMGMTPEEKAELDALKESVKNLSAEKVKLSASNQELQASLKQRDEATATAKFEADKKDIGAKLEALVKAKKCTPAQRDEIVNGIKKPEDINMAAATISVLDKGVEVKVDETDKGQKDGEGEDKDLRPDIKLASAIQKRMEANPRLSFAAAQVQVMQEQPKLAREYVDMNDGGDK